MKTFYKVLGLALLAAGMFTACTKENDTYEPGKPAGNYDVYFAKTNPSTQILALSATSFDVTVERANGSGALTVPVEFWVSTPGIATAPESVTFADGQTKASLTISVSSDMDPFTEYTANITIPEEYTQPYTSSDVYPQCGFVFYKEDYKVVATGTYYDDFWYEDSWDQDLEYSELLD